MVLAQVAQYFSGATNNQHNDTRPLSLVDGAVKPTDNDSTTSPPNLVEEAEEELEERRPLYRHATLAGGIGGLTGDMLMHSLDTVKTRQQGDPHRPPRYHSLGNTYLTILKEEGVPRGLYGGVTPAAIGSFGGTCLFFGSYEWSKRWMLEAGLAPSLAYLNAGLFADLVASPLYVPTEVLKTRLQLQGRYNNPYFRSGYNYKSTWNAAKTIVRAEGFAALFYGFRATLYRDLPFSALQFAFYEKEREAAKWWVGSKHIGLPLEILVGATAGGAAGTITCPLDVVKTRIQTQLRPRTAHAQSAAPAPTPNRKPTPDTNQRRLISTTSPSTHLPKPGSVNLDTSSVVTGLRLIYRTEGIAGWFRGVGPRAVWTSVQSGTMLVLYQALLRKFDSWSEADEGDLGIAD
ncbi:MAG: hypothetical protein M1828_001075 [Chrysothrix sp. TS-e1954]|nr:MAG: hypothetical protein M1828_001075 [Chrysothrix sp. TS-e1954]